jgi:hypothetical protein
MFNKIKTYMSTRYVLREDSRTVWNRRIVSTVAAVDKDWRRLHAVEHAALGSQLEAEANTIESWENQSVILVGHVSSTRERVSRKRDRVRNCASSRQVVFDIQSRYTSTCGNRALILTPTTKRLCAELGSAAINKQNGVFKRR